MWTIFMPEELNITLTPRLNNSGDKLIIRYKIKDQPFLEWLKDLVLTMLGGLGNDEVHITHEKIEIDISKNDLPYKMKHLNADKITLTIRKK